MSYPWTQTILVGSAIAITAACGALDDPGPRDAVGSSTAAITGQLDMTQLFPSPQKLFSYWHYDAGGNLISFPATGGGVENMWDERWQGCSGPSFTRHKWYQNIGWCPQISDAYHWNGSQLLYTDTYNMNPLDQDPDGLNHTILTSPGNAWADSSMLIDGGAPTTRETVDAWTLPASPGCASTNVAERPGFPVGALVMRQLTSTNEWSPYTGGAGTWLPAVILHNDTWQDNGPWYSEQMTFAQDPQGGGWYMIRTRGWVNNAFSWDARLATVAAPPGLCSN